MPSDFRSTMFSVRNCSKDFLRNSRDCFRFLGFLQRLFQEFYKQNPQNPNDNLQLQSFLRILIERFFFWKTAEYSSFPETPSRCRPKIFLRIPPRNFWTSKLLIEVSSNSFKGFLYELTEIPSRILSKIFMNFWFKNKKIWIPSKISTSSYQK